MNKDRGEASRRPPNAAGRSSTPRRGAPLEMRRGRAKAERLVADMGGSAALPRRSGELVFGSVWDYYPHWLASLESFLKDRGLVSEGEIDERTAQIASKAEHEHHHGE